MTWDLTADRPIYMQLIEQIQLRIVSGVYPPGDKLPAVRELASQASVNPNTMQKALSELEREGLVHTQRTTGRYITEDTEMIKHIKEDLAKEQVQAFFEKMQQIGFSKEDTLKLIEQAAKEE